MSRDDYKYEIKIDAGNGCFRIPKVGTDNTGKKYRSVKSVASFWITQMAQNNLRSNQLKISADAENFPGFKDEFYKRVGAYLARQDNNQILEEMASDYEEGR